MLCSLYDCDAYYPSSLDHHINVSERKVYETALMQLYSSCCFLFRRAFPRFRSLVADP